MDELTPFWTRGDIAKEKQVTPTTVANWDARGILRPDAVTQSGIRLYSKLAVAKLDEHLEK
jgi:DNA-binding transcriptional MerR regulator